MSDLLVIVPRECPDPRTDHCVGEVRRSGVARCQFCGRFMPLAEAIDFQPDEDFVPATYGGSTLTFLQPIAGMEHEDDGGMA